METHSDISEPLTSAALMRSVRAFEVPNDGLGVWFLGQNGFLIKTASGLVCAIDPYLTDSCPSKFADSPFDLGRELPIFLEPEDLDVDVYAITHSHEDHLDEATVRRLRCHALFLAPWDAYQKLLTYGVDASSCRLLHANETVELNGVSVRGTFAIPTDDTDLNHIGLLFEAANGVRFYNTGDTAFSEGLARLLPRDVDLCAICINGRFGNLSSSEAARVVVEIQPRIAVPTHYDMMRCNLSDPEGFRTEVATLGTATIVKVMEYGVPLVVLRSER